MAAPAIPQNVIIQQANGQVLLNWDYVAGASNYNVYRSINSNGTYSLLASPNNNQYVDTNAALQTKYYYYVTSSNSSESPASQIVFTIPTLSGDMSLYELRTRAQQRADRVNSNFVTLEEWNSYINQSYFELYDLLVTTFEDYFVKTPYIVTTNGTDNQYALPSDFYKLEGVDLGLDANQNAWVTLKKFDFISRNRYVFPNLTSTYLGVFNLRYRLVGNKLMFIPTPSGNQYLRIWYIPKMVELLQDTDIATGVSGWTEYIIVDAAIKAMQKEESDVSVLAAQKMALIKRIEETAMNRDVGQPDTISDTRSRAESWGVYGPPGGDGSYGGYAVALLPSLFQNNFGNHVLSNSVFFTKPILAYAFGFVAMAYFFYQHFRKFGGRIPFTFFGQPYRLWRFVLLQSCRKCFQQSYQEKDDWD